MPYPNIVSGQLYLIYIMEN